jgi:hypothetical protein
MSNYIGPIALYLLLAVGLYCFLQIEILPDFQEKIGLRTFELILFALLLSMTVWTHLKTTCTSPGFVPLEATYDQESLHPDDQKMLNSLETLPLEE